MVWLSSTAFRSFGARVALGGCWGLQVPSVRHVVEDAQHRHEVDWADLFFDLTYVAAAYKVGFKKGAVTTFKLFGKEVRRGRRTSRWRASTSPEHGVTSAFGLCRGVPFEMTSTFGFLFGVS